MPNHTENWDSATPPSAPTGWTLGTGMSTVAPGSSPTPISSPNCIQKSSSISTTAATWGTKDAAAGNVTVSGTGQQFSGSTSNNKFSVLARGSVSALNLASTTLYEAQFQFAGVLKLNSIVSGTSTTIGSVASFTAATGIWYVTTLTCLGTAISVTVQRLSDNNWLSSSGTWGSSPATAISVTDSSITGSGYAGWYAFGNGGNTFGDDWSLSEPLSSGTLATTESHDVFAGSAIDTAFGGLGGGGGNDVFAGLAPITHGTVSASGGSDTAALAGWCIIASLGYTEHRDTAAASGGLNSPAVLSKTAGSDSAAAAGLFTASGSLSKTAGNDTFAGAGMYTVLASAVLIGGGSDVLAATGTRSSSASIGPTERHDVLAAAGALAVAGSLGPTERHDALAAFSADARAAMAATERHDALAVYDTGVGYHIYANTGIADPINYGSPIATTGFLTWTSSPLTFPGTWRFGVRAYDTATMLEEKNLDCAVTIILDASGIDITNRPKAPTALRALARAGGTIRVEWAYNTINPSPVPTGFHVYCGIGALAYVTPSATVSFQAAIAGSFVVDLPSLINGTVYTIGVRAYNSTAEEPNTVTVNCTADAAGPAAVSSLTAIAI